MVTPNRFSILLRAAKFELSCERCANAGHITDGRGEKDECPRCFGHKRNVATIELLEAMADHITGSKQAEG